MLYSFNLIYNKSDLSKPGGFLKPLKSSNLFQLLKSNTNQTVDSLFVLTAANTPFICLPPSTQGVRKSRPQRPVLSPHFPDINPTWIGCFSQLEHSRCMLENPIFAPHCLMSSHKIKTWYTKKGSHIFTTHKEINILQHVLSYLAYFSETIFMFLLQ